MVLDLLYLTSTIRLEKRYEHYNADLSEISSSDETTDNSSSEESPPTVTSSDHNKVPPSGDEIEIDECIFSIADKSPEKTVKIKTRKRKNNDSSSKYPIPSKVRKCTPIKNKKTRKFSIKAVETKLVSFSFHIKIVYFSKFNTSRLRVLFNIMLLPSILGRRRFFIELRYCRH